MYAADGMFQPFHSWNLQIHVTSNSVSCALSVMFRFPYQCCYRLWHFCEVYGCLFHTKTTTGWCCCNIYKAAKLLVLHWRMVPSEEKMVSVEPGYPDCITGRYICGSELRPVHDPCEPWNISHYLLDMQVWSLLLDGCTSQKVWDAAVSWSDRATDNDNEAQVQQGWCTLQHRFTRVGGNLNCWICRMMARTDRCVTKTDQSSSMLP